MKPLLNHRLSLQCFFLGAVIFGVFGLSLWAQFVYDDLAFIFKNPGVIGPWHGLKHWIMSPLMNTQEYEPLVTLFHRILYSTVENRLFLYRFTSLLGHWINSVLILLIYKRLLGKESPYFWAALLFVLYPAHTEVLAISTFKKHLFVSFFGLAMIYFQERRDLKEPLRLGICWLAMVLALLSKESALILAVLLPIISLATADSWRRRLGRDAVLYIGLGFVVLAFLAFRTLVLPRRFPAWQEGGFIAHGLTSGKCLLWYLSQFVTLPKLCQEHSILPIKNPFSGEGLAVLAALALLPWLILHLWRKDRILGIAAAWCISALIPFLNLVPFLNLSLVANRYLYLACAGFFLGVGRILGYLKPISLFKKRLSPQLLLVAVLVLLYTHSGMRNLSLYSDPMDLWAHTISCAPQNPRGYAALGGLYFQAERYEEAISAYKKALERFQGQSSDFASLIYLDLSAAYAQTGRLDVALALARAQLHKAPSIHSFLRFGTVLFLKKRYAEAIPYLATVIQSEPSNASGWMGIGHCYFKLGRLNIAERFWLTAASLPESRIEALNFLGILYLKKNNTAKAREAYEKSLALDPIQIESVIRLADIYKQEKQPAASLRLYDETIAQLEARLSRFKTPDPNSDLWLSAQKALAALRVARNSHTTGRNAAAVQP